MAEPFDMNPCDRLAVGTLGEPGNRTFYLQGVQGLESYAVIIEKEQAVGRSGRTGSAVSTLRRSNRSRTVSASAL